MAIAPYPFFITYRLSEGLPKHDAGVFHRVVRVHVQISLSMDVEVEQAMARYLVKHVFEEWHANL
jgi:hypothetical protein